MYDDYFTEWRDDNLEELASQYIQEEYCLLNKKEQQEKWETLVDMYSGYDTNEGFDSFIEQRYEEEKESKQLDYEEGLA